MKALSVIALAGLAALQISTGGASEIAIQHDGASSGESSPSGGLVTLWMLDDRANSMSLNTGEPGGVLQGNEIRNRDGQLDFGAYRPGEFSVGIQGGEMGRIVDLGASADIRERFGYAETVAARQGFASIQVVGGAFRIR